MLRVHVGRLVASKLALARRRTVPHVDTTLELAPDCRRGHYPLGELVTVGVDAGRSSLKLVPHIPAAGASPTAAVTATGVSSTVLLGWRYAGAAVTLSMA